MPRSERALALSPSHPVVRLRFCRVSHVAATVKKGPPSARPAVTTDTEGIRRKEKEKKKKTLWKNLGNSSIGTLTAVRPNACKERMRLGQSYGFNRLVVKKTKKQKQKSSISRSHTQEYGPLESTG